MSSAAFDVVIVGGGPGGSVCATRLAQGGARVLVLEKELFPRFHLGESLLPRSLDVLESIGILPTIEATFIHKYGARFHDDARDRKDRFEFAGAWRTDRDHAYQVQRDRFDQVLLQHAAASGAEVREEWTVTGAVRDDDGRVVGVLARGPAGEECRFDARYVIDASGRDALFAHAARSTEKIVDLDQTALYAHYRGVPRQAGILAGDIDIVIFRRTQTARPNWFWMIPFIDGTTSVGAVVSKEWIRLQKGGADDRDALFDAAIAESRDASALLAGATRTWPKVKAAADFSYRVRELWGDGWLAVGDAGGFIDPLFSTGAHLAMCGGHAAAGALLELLKVADGDRAATEKRVLGEWSTTLRRGAETFLVAVQAFYAGPLMETLFIENKHNALRRSITSLLAGDVFSDAVWLRDTRLRLTEMTKTPHPQE